MTNGILFSKHYWELLKERYQQVNLSISIDAATEDTYQKVRGGKGWNRLVKTWSILLV